MADIWATEETKTDLTEKKKTENGRKTLGCIDGGYATTMAYWPGRTVQTYSTTVALAQSIQESSSESQGNTCRVLLVLPRNVQKSIGHFSVNRWVLCSVYVQGRISIARSPRRSPSHLVLYGVGELAELHPATTPQLHGEDHAHKRTPCKLRIPGQPHVPQLLIHRLAPIMRTIQ